MARNAIGIPVIVFNTSELARRTKGNEISPPICLKRMGGEIYIGKLFFVSFTVAGRADLIGSALHIIGSFLGATPFRGCLTNAFDHLLSLTGRTGGFFYFGHVFLLCMILQLNCTSFLLPWGGNPTVLLFLNKVILELFQ